MTTANEDTLRALLDEIRQATSEAHGVLADVRRERAELERWAAGLEHGWKVEMCKRIDDIVTENLDQFKETNNRAMDEVQKRIEKRFDTITDLILGTGKNTSVEVLAARIGAAVNHVVARAHQDGIPPALRGSKTKAGN